MINRDLGLFNDLSRDFRVVAGNHTPGIHDLERPAAPAHRSIEAIARYARLIGNDGAPLADKAVEEGGFSDIGATDYCNQRMWGRHEK
jgi:hypothetical protein